MELEPCPDCAREWDGGTMQAEQGCETVKNVKDMSVMFSSSSALWETPQAFFDTLDKEFHFQLDVCATPENTKCERFFTPEQDGLLQPWEGVCWCNPPYGRSVKDWIRKALLASAEGAVVVMLLPARTDTRWFHQFLYKKSGVELRFVPGRLKFGKSRNSAPFPSMIVVFRKTRETKP